MGGRGRERAALAVGLPVEVREILTRDAGNEARLTTASLDVRDIDRTAAELTVAIGLCAR